MRRRSGMGLLMVLVFMGIIATILALSMKALMVNFQVTRVTDTWNTLEAIRVATFNSAALATDPVFRQRVGTNPGRITELIGPITSGDATNYPNACGTAFSNPQQTASRTWTPFFVMSADATNGVATPMGNVSNSFTRTTISAVVYLMAIIPQADLTDIQMMDNLFDTGDGAAAGKVRWDTISGTTARLTYMITIDTQC